MTAFTGSVLSSSTVDAVREKYRTPMYFEWMKSGTAFTIRGVEVVYILGFEKDVVKVGQTIDFLTRLTAHRSSPRTRGLKLVCGWRLGTSSASVDEARLKELAAELGGVRMGRTTEWFTNLDVRALIARAEAALVT